ncbi:MAG: ABC transporter permease [Candidatus Rokubacteria bacterium]|nr:ABC transporter permease [Candidatus Rokubacteria bacterium]
MRQVLAYTWLLSRAYVRNGTALFFSLFLPLGFMLLFGALNLGAFGHVNLGVVDQANNDDSRRFVSSLEGITTLSVTKGALDDELARLRKSDRDMVIVLPSDFRIAPQQAGAAVPVVTVYENEGRAQQVSVGTAILTQSIDRTSFAVSRTGPVVTLKEQSISAVRLRYVDFLVPGIIGMNVMQLAIFSVAFAMVADKQRGVLRRIMATPIDPRRFFAAHVLQRLLLAVVQVLILVAIAILLFNVKIVGNIFELLVVTTVGSIMFLTIGFALAGWAKNEDQVPPIANLITLPQFFLSGVFFSRDAVPDLIRPLSNALPLTFLNDAIRDVSTSGASLWDVRGGLLGMLVWSLIGFVLAVRLFRFEQS